MDEKFRKAAQAYGAGCTCSQAVFCAFAEDLGLDEQTALKLIEGFGGGFGGKQEVCGAFCAATAVISYYYSTGKAGDVENRPALYAAIQRAAELFEREYGSIRCIEILHGEKPKPRRCGMKVKDAVFIAERFITERNGGAEK